MSAQVTLSSVSEFPNYPDPETCRREYWFSVDGQSVRIQGAKTYPSSNENNQAALFEVEFDPSSDVDPHMLGYEINSSLRGAAEHKLIGRTFASFFGAIGIAGAGGEVALVVSGKEQDPTPALIGGSGILILAGLAAYWQLRVNKREAKKSIARADRLVAIADHLGIAVSKQ